MLMIAFLYLIGGGVIGFFSHIVVMKINFQQRTITNKIKVFDTLIATWMQMRNQLVHGKDKNKNLEELDKIYGKSLVCVAEAILISNDEKLVLDIDNFNEELYRRWYELSEKEVGERLEKLKKEGIKLISRMRKDIKKNTKILSIFK